MTPEQQAMITQLVDNVGRVNANQVALSKSLVAVAELLNRTIHDLDVIKERLAIMDVQIEELTEERTARVH